jgi:biopolymer transport protein TolR
VRKDGAVFLNEFDVGMENLATQLAAVVKAPSRRLFLQADKEVPYGVVVSVMGKIRAAGIEELGIVAERLDDEAPGGKDAQEDKAGPLRPVPVRPAP